MPKELTMQEIQAVSLEILKQVADLCEELNLRYFLAWETLIGAVCHKGFIPWDDDVDIMMPRRDYDRTDAQTIVDRMKVEKKILIKTYPNVGEFGNCLRVSIGEQKYMEQFTTSLVELDK
ncbi:LicD family protein [Oribacterium sp. NK2B42]|uniref:LicD family protein n=1 Tax=Oribacterium sp. NK2B42 TaxID=689781 RepID=UPI00040A9749|nr:LicD family protein [Oribacterium sp. NK2B42]